MFNLDVISSTTSMSNINGLTQFSESIKNTGNTKNTEKVEFSNVLEKVISDVNESQLISNEKVDKFIKGEDVAVHDVMIAMNEAQMSMQLLIEVRNKIVEAYQEINRLSL